MSSVGGGGSGGGSSNSKTGGISATIDGGGAAISTGKTKGYFTAPFGGTITGWSISVDTGTLTFKVWKIATGTAVPTVANVINTSGVAISSGTSVRSATVTDFTSTTITAGDIVAFQITAVSGPTEATLAIEILKS